jgi:hypothetical protein
LITIGRITLELMIRNQAAMYKLSEAAVLVVADQVRDVLRAVDTALEAGVPAGTLQSVLDNLIASMSAGRAMRESTVKASGQLQVIHRRSDQAHVAAGCPTPWHDIGFTTASLKSMQDPETTKECAREQLCDEPGKMSVTPS